MLSSIAAVPIARRGDDAGHRETDNWGTAQGNGQLGNRLVLNDSPSSSSPKPEGVLKVGDAPRREPSGGRTRYETLEVRILPVLGRGPTGGAPASAGMVPGRVLGQLVHSAASSMPAGGEENIVSQLVIRPRVESYSSARVPLACRRVALCNRWGTQLRGGVRIRWPHIISATYSLVAPCRTRTHWHTALFTLCLITLAASLRRIVHAGRR